MKAQRTTRNDVTSRDVLLLLVYLIVIAMNIVVDVLQAFWATTITITVPINKIKQNNHNNFIDSEYLSITWWVRQDLNL